MPDLIVSSDIDTLLSSANTSSARTNLQLGSTDTVEFGALETSQLNFPNLSTSELNAVTDATEGDTYFDSDRGQFVRFTGAASHEVITVRGKYMTDLVAPVATLTLSTSGFLEAGLVEPEANPFSPVTSVNIKVGGSNIDGSGYSNTSSYFYHDGSSPIVGNTAGWYKVGTLTPSDAVSVPSNSLIVFNSSGKTPFTSNLEIVSDNTPNELVSEDLLAGATYSITIALAASDMLNGNLVFASDYTGLFTDARAVFTADDTKSGVRLGTFSGDLPPSIDFEMSEGGPYGFDSPAIGYYTFTFNITPSSAGTWSFSVKQGGSNILPIYISKADVIVTLLTD